MPSLLLLLLACQPDPLIHPDLLPPITDPLVVSLGTVSVSIGQPMEVPVHFEGPNVVGNRAIVTSNAGIDGRGVWDEWNVVPGDGLRDPSPYWEDHQVGRDKSHASVTPKTAVDVVVRLDESIRFPHPGRYGIQLTTVRGLDRVRSKPVVLQVGPAGDTGARSAALLKSIEQHKGPERDRAFIDLAMLGAPDILERAVAGTSDPLAGRHWSLVVHAHPDRAKAQATVEAQFEAVDAAVSPQLLETHAALCYNQAYDWPARLPKATNADTKRFEMDRGVRRQALARCRAESAAALAAQVERKKDAALGATLSTLMQARLMRDGGEAPWHARVSTLASQSLHAVAPKVLRTWLSEPRYWAILDHQAIGPSLVRLADAEASLVADLALSKLARLDPDEANRVLQARYDRAKIAVSEDVEVLFEAVPPTPTQLDALISGLDLQDAIKLRIAARYSTPEHGAAWSELFATVPDTVPTATLGAVAAGLMNSKHVDAEVALARFGPRHPLLLSEAARVARDLDPLLERAAVAVRINERVVSMAAGDLIAEHGDAGDLRRVLLLVEHLDGAAELGAVIAICTGRRWLINSAMLDRIGRTLSNHSAISMAKQLSTADKPLILIEAFDAEGQPGMRFSTREYVGQDAIVTKLKQMHPARGIKIAYNQISSTEKGPLYEGFVESAGLTVVKSGK